MWMDQIWGLVIKPQIFGLEGSHEHEICQILLFHVHFLLLLSVHEEHSEFLKHPVTLS